MAWIDPPLRLALTAAHKLLQAGWLIRRPRTYGAHAIALTPDRKLILVKLRYAAGWRVPGGSRSRGEYAQAAAIRELREEIGMTSHGRIRLACELEEHVAFKRDLSALLIVEDVRYHPRRWSWEVEKIGEFPLHDLPRDTSRLTRRWIESLRERF
ncbi:MAG TPA: NUDIX domain-containing protein [Sphingomicrobium sp.]|jgi:8-oxo-dGTP pyrophosphatase MutT (NUDIX family)|nr:NUDIX domain-containing protein [Sphingomicrobium sp.]